MPLLMVFMLCLATAKGQTTADEDRLRGDLFRKYEAEIRPPYNRSSTLYIDVSYVITAVNDIDDTRGVLYTTGTFCLTWTDDRLAWKPDNYGGLSEISIQKKNQTWMPLLYAINTADLKDLESGDVFVRLSSQGLVFWMLETSLETSFEPDMTFFPFDTQTCGIELIAIGHFPNEVYLRNATEYVNTTFIKASNVWDIRETRAMPFSIGTTDGLVKFELKLKRRHEYYTVTMVVPLFTLTIMTTMVFLMPTESGQRVSYSVILLPSFGVYLSNIDDHLPEVSEQTAYLSYLLLLVLTGSALSTVITIVTVNLYQKGDTMASVWLCRVIDGLSFRWIKYLVYLRTNRKHDKEQRTADSWIGRPERHRSWRGVAREIDTMAFVYSWIGITITIITMLTLLFFKS